MRARGRQTDGPSMRVGDAVTKSTGAGSKQRLVIRETSDKSGQEMIIKRHMHRKMIQGWMEGQMRQSYKTKKKMQGKRS